MITGTHTKILVRDLSGKIVREWEAIMDNVPIVGDDLVFESNGRTDSLNRSRLFRVKSRTWVLDMNLIVLETVSLS